MSMNKYTYAMAGIRRKKSEINIFEDDNFLPLLDEEDDFLSVKYGEVDDYIYIGRIVGKSEPYSEYVSQKLQFPSHQEVAHHLDQYGFNVCGSDVDNWFFDVCR